MDNLLKKIEHRYCKTEDEDYNYMLLTSSNLYYFYLSQDKNKELIISFKETEVNIAPRKPQEYIFKKLILKKSITDTLFEGVWNGKRFYITDILVKNGVLMNYNVKTRIMLVQKFLDEYVEGKEILSSPYFCQEKKLEKIYNNIIPSLNINIKYILMKKNITQNLIELESNHKNNNEEKKEQEKKILRHLENPVKNKKISEFTVHKTKTVEIYVIDHKDFYSVLRVPDLKTSMFLKNKPNVFNLKCKFNEDFKKYECCEL